MARRKKSFLAAFALLAVMAIGSLGLGYAYWSDALQVNGTVNTGTLDMRWAVGATQPDNDGSSGPLNVGSCSTSGNSGKTLSVVLNNAYPGYSCTVTASIVQNGSVPGQALAPSGISYDSSVLGFSGFSCTPGSTIIGATETCTGTVSVLSSVSASSTQGQAYTFTATLNFENYHP